MIVWENDIADFLKRSIDLFRKFYVSGELQYIRLELDTESACVDVVLALNEEEYVIDYDSFEVPEKNEDRDEQRECYFENEVIWGDFFMAMQYDIVEIEKRLRMVTEQLKVYYQVEVSVVEAE